LHQGSASSIARSAAGFCVAAEEPGLTLSLSYKQVWSGAQRAAADQKVAALDAAAGRGELQVTEVERAGTSAAARYRQAGGAIPPLSDVDLQSTFSWAEPTTSST
jgi:hypothetical protein